jgi:hypothetical protein
MSRFVGLEELFKGRHLDSKIVVLCVRWYLSFKLSYRDLVSMMSERGICLAHTRSCGGYSITRRAVLQREEGELVTSEIDKITAGNFQVAAERTGSHPHGSRLVFAFFSVVPGCGRAPDRTRPRHRSRDGLALGAEIALQNWSGGYERT